MTEPGSPTTLPGPVSGVVWGSKRADLDRLAIGLARALGKEVFWVDIQIDATFSPGETAVLQELDPSHSIRVAPEEVAVNQNLGNLALWSIVQEPVKSPESLRLSDYLRIPARLRSIVDRTGPTAGAVAIVVANADRATGFYGGLPGEFTPFLQELKRLGVSIILTNAGIPRGNTSDFDVVLRVTREPESETATVYCSRADSRLENRFTVGAFVPLTQLLSALTSA